MRAARAERLPAVDSSIRLPLPLLRSMARSVALSLIIVASFPASIPARAGIIDPAYERHLATAPPDSLVSVIIFLQEQAPIAALDEQLRADQAPLRDRHEQVVVALQQTAAATQSALLADLAARQAAGEVRGYTAYWIANLAVAQMTVRAAREVASRSDVAEVEANFTLSLIEPIGGVPRQGEPEVPAAGSTPGLRAINAPRVWAELGIAGAGRLVCGLDTGVMGSHVALQSRWRGAQPGVPWQHAWKDVLGTNTQSPNDSHGHGTHTMGTMVGLGAATQDTVGVAWGAQWIACNAINQGVGSEFDNDVIAAFQWIADPDGNPQTVSDVPDVVQNSWRINEGFPGGYTDCDSRWWAVMDGCEVAGCAVVFSAGNEGPGSQTIGSPPDRITTPTNAYAIGAVDANGGFPYPIASFSSRGPSGCDGVTKKPEVVAPGVSVRSTTNDGGYQQSGWNGTSMAGPHVSGIFALMREANPNIDVATMKQIIMDTARDLGAAGEDNTFGWGIPDAYEAVLTAATGYGEIAGTITTSASGDPIPNAEVEISSRGLVLTTDAGGRYQGFLAAGTVDAEARHPAFLPVTREGIVIIAQQQTVVDFDLDPRPDAVPPEIQLISCLYATESTVGPYAIEAEVTDNLEFVRASLFYRVNGGAFTQLPMQAAPADRYLASVPGHPIGSTIDYYIEARDAAANLATDPPGAPGTTHSFWVTNAITPVFADDAEIDQGWTLGVVADLAITGRWQRGDPPGTFIGFQPLQPEDDHTPGSGSQCFVTQLGNAGDPNFLHDVDGGCTTLVSPAFDLAGAQEAVLSYWRWWATFNPVDDALRVEVSSDDGVSWTPVETLATVANSWTQFTTKLRCLVDLTSTMRVRFIACDNFPSDSLTEGAVDDVVIARFDPATAGAAEGGTGPQVARRFYLGEARPNPFNPSTVIPFDIAVRDHVSLRIYDAGGRLVRTLVDGILDAGAHRAIFDGRGEDGSAAASGIYFIRLDSGAQTATRKIHLLK